MRVSRGQSLEHRHRLDVRRVREHVDHTRCREPIAALVDQHAGVARERGRTARHIDDPREAAVIVALRQRLDELDGAFARRIDQRAIEPAERRERSPASP